MFLRKVTEHRTYCPSNYCVLVSMGFMLKSGIVGGFVVGFIGSIGITGFEGTLSIGRVGVGGSTGYTGRCGYLGLIG